MTKTKWFLTCVLVSTLLSSVAFAQVSEFKATASKPVISIFPNPSPRGPVTAKITFTKDQEMIFDSCLIFNMIGKVVEGKALSLNITTETSKITDETTYCCEYDFSNQANGIYFVQMNYHSADDTDPTPYNYSQTYRLVVN